MTGSARALMPDYLRLVALFGIVVVNVQYIAFSALGSFADPGGETTLDAITLWLVNGLALLKTYGLPFPPLKMLILNGKTASPLICPTINTISRILL